MLSLLRRIVQEVNDAEGMSAALEILVASVKKAMGVDMCAIYQQGPDGNKLSLVATDGLNPDAVGTVHLALSGSLVGLVAERAEPINLENMSSHPRYQFVCSTGEERFRSFLGVPIIFQRKNQGVLVVQQTAARKFDEDHVAFLMTLAAQVASALSRAEFSGGLGAGSQQETRDIFFKGIAGSPGVVIGDAVVAFPATDLESVPDRKVSDAEKEEALFLAAVASARKEITELKEMLSSRLPAEEAALFDAYGMMLSGGSLIDSTVDYIRQGRWAAGALRKTVREHMQLFEAMDEAYLRERSEDILDLGQRILKHLLQTAPFDTVHFSKNTVLVGTTISASQLAEIPSDRLGGLVSVNGSSSSHVAILARALGIPAVMGVEGFPVSLLDGKEIILNGYDGCLYVQPSGSVKAEFLTLARQEKELSVGLLEAANEPAHMTDGDVVPVMINSGLMPESLSNQSQIADGIGLYRTELPFMVREQFPGEREQTLIYRQVLESFPASPVVLRMLDVGGDKSLSYFPINDENPFLGFRGIRILLDHPDIFITQLRAMLLANEPIGNLEILFPMIGSLSELDEALMLLEYVQMDLRREGHSISRVRVGVMIEVPSAVYLARELAERVDFLSIGSNDLVQYLLAVDRNNSRVARLYDDTSPAVLRALQQTIDSGHQAGRPVSICGEMASDPAAVLLLLGMGIDSLSVNAASLPRVKWVIRSFSREHARKVFRNAQSLNESAAIRCLLERELIDAGLGALVRAGR